MIDTIEQWPVDRLRSHPENSVIFGNPKESDHYEPILQSIRASGIWEPLIVRADGTVLSGHKRLACALELKRKTVPVRVWEAFDSYLDEVKFVIRANTDRAHLSKMEIAFAFKRLKEIPRAEGGAKGKRGGDHGNQHVGGKRQPAESRGLAGDTRDAAADLVGVSRDIAEACETVFTTPGVPEELKAAVNSGKVKPTTAAREVRAEVKRQGGALSVVTPLVALAEKKPAAAPKADTHETRVAEKAEQYRAHYARAVKAYREVDSLLTTMPLKSVIGPTEHGEYMDVIRDLAIRAWREVESVQGPTTMGKQMALSVISGGKRS